MKRTLVCFALTSSLLLTAPIFAGGDVKNIDPQTTVSLKDAMRKFGTLIAGVEILSIKEKKPDWRVIEMTVEDMDKTLKEIQSIDKNQSYKVYTDLLSDGISDLRKYTTARDRNIYKRFEKVEQTCFQCHSAHRPDDYLIPKKKRTANAGKQE